MVRGHDINSVRINTIDAVVTLDVDHHVGRSSEFLVLVAGLHSDVKPSLTIAVEVGSNGTIPARDTERACTISWVGIFLAHRCLVGCTANAH